MVAPLAEIARQRLRAGHVVLAAPGLVDGAIAAHEVRQEILHLPFPRVAPGDAQPLAGRRRIDVEPGLRR